MTKEQAFKQSREQNVPIRHRYFLPGEHIRINGNSVTTEEGYNMSLSQFEHDKQLSVWETDWEIVN